MTPIAFLFTVAVILASMASYSLGKRHGEQHGKDAGWLEHYFRGVELDRPRRNRIGQFKAKGNR